jgi:hypothetical protein
MQEHDLSQRAGNFAVFDHLQRFGQRHTLAFQYFGAFWVGFAPLQPSKTVLAEAFTPDNP